MIIPLRKYKGRGLFKKTKAEIEKEKALSQKKADERKNKKLRRLESKIQILKKELNKENPEVPQVDDLAIQEEDKS